MTTTRRIAAAGTLVLAAAALAGCASVDTAPDQVALHYAGGGVMDSRKFVKCVGPSTLKNFQGAGENFYYYPAGRRTFKFSTDAGSDAGPLTASTSDEQEITVKGTITFTLNPSCRAFTDGGGKHWPGGKLQKFHELIGAKNWNGHRAYSTEPGEDPGAGWDAMIGVYIKDVADRAVDNEALKYRREQLYNNARDKAHWEKDVIAAIPGLVKAQAGEDFFVINNVVLQKPDISDVLKAQLANKQAAVLRSQTAETDKATATKFPGGITGYLNYQRQLAVNKAIESGQVKVLPVPQGSDIIVAPN